MGTSMKIEIVMIEASPSAIDTGTLKTIRTPNKRKRVPVRLIFYPPDGYLFVRLKWMSSIRLPIMNTLAIGMM